MCASTYLHLFNFSNKSGGDVTNWTTVVLNEDNPTRFLSFTRALLIFGAEMSDCRDDSSGLCVFCLLDYQTIWQVMGSFPGHFVHRHWKVNYNQKTVYRLSRKPHHHNLKSLQPTATSTNTPQHWTRYLCHSGGIAQITIPWCRRLNSNAGRLVQRKLNHRSRTEPYAPQFVKCLHLCCQRTWCAQTAAPATMRNKIPGDGAANS